MVYYCERTKIKISRDRKQVGQSLKKPSHNLSCVLPVESYWTTLNSPRNNVWQHSWNVTIQGSSLEPWCPGTLWALVMLAQRVPMADLYVSVLSSSIGQMSTIWPKACTVNHIVSISHLAWPKDPGKQKHSYQARNSKRLSTRRWSRVKTFFGMFRVWITQTCLSNSYSKWALITIPSIFSRSSFDSKYKYHMSEIIKISPSLLGRSA